MTTLGPTRAHLLDIIRQEPGINKSGLRERSGLAWGTIHYHLGILRRAGEVQVVQTPWEALHFLGALPPAEVACLAALREVKGRTLAGHLQKASGSRTSELARSLGWSRKVISRHLTVLGRAGLVEKRGLRQAEYSLRQEAAEILERLRAQSGERPLAEVETSARQP